MGFLDWLQNLLGGSRQPPRRPTPPTSMPSRYEPVEPVPAARAQPPARKEAQKPRGRTLDLSASQFTPLSDADVKKQAQNLPWSGWFGRRDRIPPSTDPRTNLIDRALVAHGLLTPEQLAEIHAAGQKMDELRPNLALIASLAQQAVQRSREERLRIKAQKKAEAAERLRKHKDAVAHRRATDINYLGRGVSAGLADRRANVEKLQSQNLPVLATPADIAAALKITIPRLRWLAFHSEAATRTHYVRFTVPKRSGGTRELCAPHREIFRCQEWILTSILEKVPAHQAAHGFIRGRSTVSNASPHVGKRIIVNADLKDFFPTITVHRVIGLFRHLGYSPAAATILALICTEAPRRTVTFAGTVYHVATGPRGLPQGAATSPALSNLIARRLDSRLHGIAAKLDYAYTRYADDLSFSADSDEKIGYLLARIRHIAEDEGFAVNESKTRVQRRHHAMTVTGVVVNEKPSLNRKTRRRLRAILHQAKKTGLEAQNRRNLPHFELHIKGMIAYAHMINPEQARPPREALKSIPR